MTRLNPYLNFAGNTEEAFNFYRTVFGGEFAGLMRFGDAPGCDEMPVGEADRDKIMHIALPIGDGNVLMATDMIDSMGQKLEPGNNFSLSLSPESRAEADRLFAALGDGGKVQMPLADAFWGDYFGMVEDRFGVRWMISHSPQMNGNSN